MSQSIASDLLAALDIVVLEQTGQRTFAIVGPAPTWFDEFWQEPDSQAIKLAELFPFMDYFLVDAENLWANKSQELLKSGLWTQVGRSGQEIHLEASALNLKARRILLIVAPESDFIEKSLLIQRARTNSLNYLTDRKQVSKKLVSSTFYDVLTGMPNQTYFSIQLTQAFERAKQEHHKLAVMVINIDRFKLINNSLGQSIADRLLITFAWRIKDCLDSQAILVRAGGDEFFVLMDPITDVETTLGITNQILARLKPPFSNEEQEVYISASIGVAFSGPEYEEAQELLRDANTAMHHAKALGRARYMIFDQVMHTQAMSSLQLENDLHRAVREQELQIYYQPIVAVETSKVLGFEALVRWFHPERGAISPLEFIPIAEETGLIGAIDKWILREACFRIQQWRKFVDVPLTISVNLSAKQFELPNFAQQVNQILRETSIDPKCLKLELKESFLLSELQTAIATLINLKELGVQLCIDDFGTGYASLSYLQQLPIDTLKIDHSFINQLDQTDLKRDASNLVRTVIKLAHDLGITVSAEGVETRAQFQELLELDCDYAQGCLFSEPVNSQTAAQYLFSN